MDGNGYRGDLKCGEDEMKYGPKYENGEER